ncbi:hypothetical protein BH24CHL9_BH24CHL9_07280 [soil metagenome]
MNLDSHVSHSASLVEGSAASTAALLDALAVAVYTTNAAGGITYFNEAAVALWGRRPSLGEQWCGSLRLYRTDGSPLSHAECPMAITLREGRSVRDIPAILERPDGQRVWFMPYPTPLFQDGTLVGGLNALMDITKQREADETLRQTAMALASSNRVKDEFLSLVSHELRTPVTTVFGNADMLRSRYESLSDADRRSMISDIAEDSARLWGVVDNLLTMGGAMSAELVTEPQLLGRLIGRSVARFRTRHPGRSVDFDPPDSELMVSADEEAVDLVIDNLLSNADKYSPCGASIKVQMGPESDRPFAWASILDRGMGLEPTDTARVFEPFYRSAKAKAHASGLGIGLAVAQRLMEWQGGSVEARRRAGGGSEFRLRLPLYED